MERRIWVFALVWFAACSGEPAANPDKNSVANNDTTSTTASTTGSNNATTATNNTGSQTTSPTNNSTTNNPATNNADPTAPFNGLCAQPEVGEQGEGCTWSWRCSNLLTLDCIAAAGDDVSCQCVNGRDMANTFTTDGRLCAATAADVTNIVADQCDWNISYTTPLQCSAGNMTGGGNSCTWSWDCGGTLHAVQCEDDRNGGVDCSCLVDRRPNGIAFPSRDDPCSGTVDNARNAARAGCGWDITTN